MISEYTDRRTILRAVGIGVAVSLAGCSESDSAEAPEGSGDSTQTDEGTESLTSDDESSGSGNSEDSTPQTETGQGQQPYEQNESDAEVEYENLLSSYTPNWIEMENTEEQLPEENFDTEKYPALQLFTESGSERVDPYSAGKAFYLGWDEEQGGQIVLVANTVNDYESQEGEQGTSLFTEQDADIEGILEEVVEGYNEVSENVSDEYLEALQS